MEPPSRHRSAADVTPPRGSLDPDEPGARSALTLGRRLLDRTTQPFAEINFDGRFLRVNRAFEDLTGYSSAELSHLTVRQITPEAWHRVGSEALDRVRKTGQATRYEKEYVRKDGTVIPVEVAVDLDRDDSEHPTGYFAFVTEISERKRFEQALRENEERFRRLYDEAPFGYHEIDAEGRIVSINRTECEMLGYSREELIGRPIHEIVAESGREMARRAVRAKLSGEQPLRPIERTYQTRDGRTIEVAIEERYILDEEGKISGIRSTLRDITDRKRAEQALIASEARYRQLTEGCLDAIVVADRQGRITLFNSAAERTFGYASEEMIGQDMSVLIPEGLQEHRSLGRTLEMSGRRKNGETFPMEISLSVVEIAGEPQYIGAIRDQTERQRMWSMLVQSEKLASIGLLSAGVAHEINNPLAYVANNLAVLERDLCGLFQMIDTFQSARDSLRPSFPELIDQVDKIADDLDWDYVKSNLPRMITRTREGVQRVANIVQNLRGLARTAPPKMEPTVIPELVSSVLEMVQGRLRRKGIRVEARHEASPRVPCVSNQISQVILNLVVNAIQAIEGQDNDQGGRITVTTRTSGEEFVLEVADDGCGIDPALIPKLFDPFYTTKPVGEGTGLGLSISHGIVTGHGGRIEVESEPGKGTCFRVLLPLQSS